MSQSSPPGSPPPPDDSGAGSSGQPTDSGSQSDQQDQPDGGQTAVDNSFQNDQQDQADGGQTAVDNSFQSDQQDQADGGQTAVDNSFQSDQQDQPDGGLGTIPPPEDPETSPDAGAAVAGTAVAGVGMAVSMVPAYIQCLDPSLPFPPIIFPYNPQDIQINTVGKWTSGYLQPATQGPSPQWQGVQPAKVNVKMLLDAFSVPPIPPSVVIEQLKQMVLPTILSVGMGNAKAPYVMFGWGPNVILEQAYIQEVQVTYKRYLLGMPVRAEVLLVLQSVPLPFPLGATNPTSGGLATRRTRTMVAGDTLASIAFQEYEDPNKWRALAEVNKIDDPMRVKPGTVLTVPERREADALS